MARAELSSMKHVSKTNSRRSHHPHAAHLRRRPEALRVEPIFCPADVADPFDTVEWDRPRRRHQRRRRARCCSSKPTAKSPRSWSQLATNVVVSKYFYGEIEHARAREQRPPVDPSRQPHDRRLGPAKTATSPRADDGERFYRELTWLCLHQHGAFNSPGLVQRRPVPPIRREGLAVQLALGRRDRCGQAAGESVRISARLGLLHPERAATTWKTSWSSPAARPCCSSSARAPAPIFRRSARTAKSFPAAASPSGPLSFMRVYDQIAAVVKSGGKTRRAAKMQSLKVWHPDIMEFIECKAKEEKKARVLIEKGGYEANFNGEAYSSILFQNANLSVRVTDEFMQAVDRRQALDHALGHRARRAGPIAGRPATCWPRMAECAWHCGDPGVQYDTTINRWNTCPNSGRINASNPCSRVHVPRRHGLQPGQHQPDEVPPATTARSTSSGSKPPAASSSSPRKSWSITPAIRPSESPSNSHRFRPLGLGYSNLGSLIMAGGIAYDSRRRPRPVRRDDGPAARRGQSDQRRTGRGGRSVRRLSQRIASRCWA